MQFQFRNINMGILPKYILEKLVIEMSWIRVCQTYNVRGAKKIAEYEDDKDQKIALFFSIYFHVM